MASSKKDISMQKKDSPSKSQINQIHGYIVNPCLLNVLNAFLFQPHQKKPAWKKFGSQVYQKWAEAVPWSMTG